MLIERLAIPLDPDCQNDHREKRDLPKLKADIDDVVSFQKNAADNAKKMSERENFADHLGPARHSAERKHESRKQDRREKNEESHLHRLKLIFRDRGKSDSHRKIRGDENQRDD